MRLWKKAIAAMAAGVLCVGSVGVTGLQGVLESVGTVLSASAIVSDDYDGKYDNLYFKVLDDGIEIVSYSGGGIVEIPSEIAGKPVTKIKEDVFQHCSAEKVFVSDFETWYAIEFCSKDSNPLCGGGELYVNGEEVTEVVIPNNMTNIGNYAFYGCTSLTSVSIPNSVASIGDHAFSQCVNLTDVNISNSVKEINESAFMGCINLSSIKIPEGVKEIKQYVFAGCQNLNSIEIPGSVTSIGGGSFSSCKNLKKVYISDIAAWCAIDFGYEFFDYTYRDGNPLINGADLYIDGKKATEIVIPDGVNKICDCAFYNCTSLTGVVIPDSVTYIGINAFSRCVSLTSVTIPSSITKIDYGAFEKCNNLKSVYISDIGAWCGIDFVLQGNPLCNGADLYLNGKKPTNIVIPDGVTNIGDSAFYGCTSLISITIPNSVTKIESNVFNGCTNLESVTIQNWKTGIEFNENRRKAFGTSVAVKFTVPDTFNQKENGEYGEGERVSVATNVTHLNVTPKNGNIPPSSYENIKQLKEVVLEDGITLIDSEAFENCTELEKIVIPRSVTSIRYTAFNHDSNLTIYGYEDSYAHTFANMLDIPFVALDGTETPGTTTEITTTETTSTTETTTTTAAPITGGLVCGDINLDGRVDITDAVLLNKFCSGAITLDDTAKKNADCNGDGEPGSGDAVVLLQFLVHIVDTLPYSA